MGDDIRRVAVLGAGSMGHGIAEIAALAGYDVVLRDIEEEYVENGYDQIEWSLGKLAEKSQIDQDPDAVLERIRTTTDLEAADEEAAVYEILVDAAEGILEFDLVAVDVVEDDALIQEAWTLNLDTEGYYEETPLTDDTFATRAYHRQETIVVDDLRRYEITPADPDYRSALTVPIADIGIFQTVSRELAAFDEADRELAELLVGHAREALTRLESERQLREHTEELVRQNERLDEFATIVSHDLRNPLNVAEGRLELAREECNSEQFDYIADALGRMSTLINDTLTLARHGQMVTEREPVVVTDLVDRCWRRVTPTDAELELSDEVTVRADPDRLQQVFVNLVRNAVDHSDGTVTVTVGKIDGTGFFVEDDGPGIPADERTEVLERGYTTSEDGTGFGLAIVSEIVEAHGWTVGVTESAAGGARFEFTDVDVLE